MWTSLGRNLDLDFTDPLLQPYANGTTDSLAPEEMESYVRKMSMNVRKKGTFVPRM